MIVASSGNPPVPAPVYLRDQQFWSEAGLPTSSAPVDAIQYTGTPEAAESIAATFGLTVVVQFERIAVFRVPVGPTIAVDGYDHDNREFGVIAGGWVWRDRVDHTIGAEWHEYFREHFTATDATAVADPTGARHGE